VSVSSVLYAALGPLVSNRCYPNEFPQKDGHLPDWPAIRYTIVTEDAPASQCGTNDESTDDTGVQLDLVAGTYAAMRSLKVATLAALDATDPPCHRTGGAELYDAETKTHRAVLFYTFQASSPTP
jgi:hypothetical protein